MKIILWFFVWLLTGGMPALADSVPVLAEFSAQKAIRVPAAVIALPEGEHAILVEKQTQRLFVYRQDGGLRPLTRVFDTACSTGEAPGSKQVEGDKKTPEGVYFLIGEHLEKDLTPIYGPRAFPTDYPHLLDRQQGKTGYAIWIHGTNKPLKPMDTNGCIALKNTDVVRLSDYVNRHVTPVIIQQTIPYADPQVLVEWKTEIIRFLGEWIQAQHSGTGEAYQAFYLPESLPDSREWEAWAGWRQKASDSGAPMQIQISRIGIYRHNDLFVVAMDMALIRERKSFLLGRRSLYVQQDGSGMLRIGADGFQGMDPPRTSLTVMAAGVAHLLPPR